MCARIQIFISEFRMCVVRKREEEIVRQGGIFERKIGVKRVLSLVYI